MMCKEWWQITFCGPACRTLILKQSLSHLGSKARKQQNIQAVYLYTRIYDKIWVHSTSWFVQTTLRPRGSNLRHRIHRNLAALLFGPALSPVPLTTDDGRFQCLMQGLYIIHIPHSPARRPPADRCHDNVPQSQISRPAQQLRSESGLIPEECTKQQPAALPSLCIVLTRTYVVHM